MKVLLLFVSVVCVVQANVVVQVVQEVGEDGYGDDKEGGGGGEGGGGSGLVTLQNHLNDLYIQLSNLEDRNTVVQQAIEEVYNLTLSVGDFLKFLEAEQANGNGGSAGRHRRSVVELEGCDPHVDLSGEIDNIIIKIFAALANELPIIVISMDLTKWRCYTNGMERIISDVQNGTADAPDYDSIEPYSEELDSALNFFFGAVLYLVDSLEADIADVQAQIAEMGGTTEAAGTSND